MKWLLLILLLMNLVIAGCDNNQIDINSASIAELDEITWVGEATAEKIINERPYEKVDDLDKVSGIGEIKLGDIIEEGLACVEDEDIVTEIVDEEVSSDLEEVSVDEIEKVDLEKRENEVVVLATDENDEIIYTSKSAKVSEYLPYTFAVFLILIIGVLVWERF